MKTILVLSPHPDFAEAVRTSLAPENYRIVHRHSVDEGEPLLVHGLVAACILDADLMGVECVWVIERLRRRDTKTPIIAYSELPQADWEEEAFLRGVTQILTKPVRHRLLNSILDRLWEQSSSQRPVPAIPTGNTAIFCGAAFMTCAGAALLIFPHAIARVPDSAPFWGSVCHGSRRTRAT